jgi:hypothetical protein
MNLWIYAKSSHRDGLENVRRCAALANYLHDFSATLCSGDYRAATIAKDTLKVKKTMGIDAMGNLPYTMERLDILIYDNEDVTQEMHSQMKEFSSKLYRVGQDIPFDIVDDSFFESHAREFKETLFFGDDDYNKWFVSFCKDSKKYEIALLNGNYFFLDVQAEFLKSFSGVVDEEEYMERIAKSEYILSASIHACLESLAAGNKPVFFQRGDKAPAETSLVEKYNIPVAIGENLDELMQSYELRKKSYPQTKAIEKVNIQNIKDEIKKTFEAYAHITPAMDYSHYYPNKGDGNV